MAFFTSGLCGQGVSAVPEHPQPSWRRCPCITRPAMTHSRTRSKHHQMKLQTKHRCRGRAEGTGRAGHSQVRAWGCFPAPSAAGGVSALPGAPGLVRACADTAQLLSSCEPGTAALGKMRAAAFKQSSCLSLKQLETAVRS